MRVWAIALAVALFLPSCSGSIQTFSSSLPAAGTYAPTSFILTAPNATTSTAKRPLYVGAGTQSVSFQLVSVNGAPTSGTPPVTHANVNVATCPCVIAGPAAAVGSDVFAISTYDGQYTNGVQNGKLISTATSGTINVVPNTTNTIHLTLNGVIATVNVSLPSATAGSPFATPAPLQVVAKDGDGYIIVGAYNSSITLSNNDTSGATSITTSGSDNPPAATLVSSSDTATISYTGLAIAPINITASAPAISSAIATFSPAHTIAYSGTQNGTAPEIALTTTTGTGNFTASEMGWTNAPYNHVLSANAAGCATIATIAQSGATFTVNAVASPVPGSCVVQLSDFTSGSTLSVTIAYVHGSQTFSYTGAQQSFTVPFGISQVTIAAAGAQGGSSGATGGLGGSVTAAIPVIQNEPLAVFVGQMPNVNSGGFGGGGNALTGGGGGGGGGASDVREGGTALSNRVIVAGGGGGGSAAGPLQGGAGGLGATAGQDGLTAPAIGAAQGGGGGGGGAVSAGGNGGIGGADPLGSPGTNGLAGTLGVGGDAGGSFAGGGGGGYFGGGGGATGGSDGRDGFAGSGTGGGGSSYAEPSAIGVTNQGGNAGNGRVTISW